MDTTHKIMPTIIQPSVVPSFVGGDCGGGGDNHEPEEHDSAAMHFLWRARRHWGCGYPATSSRRAGWSKHLCTDRAMHPKSANCELCCEEPAC